MKSILNAISDNLLFVNKSLRIKWMNEAAGRSADVSLNEVINKTCYGIWYKRDKPCPNCPVIRAIETGTGANSRMQTLDGNWWDVRAEAVIDHNGKVIGAIDFARNITKVIQSKASEQRSLEFSSNILKHSPNPIIVINKDTSIRYVNPAFEKLAGFTAAEAIGQTPPYSWCTEANQLDVNKFFKEALYHRKTQKSERLFKNKRGELFYVESNTVCSQESDNTYCICNWVDINEQKRLSGNMQYYISQITKAQEEERKRVSRELHDVVVQDLLNLQLIFHQLNDEDVQMANNWSVHKENILDNINKSIDDVRNCSQNLRPGLIEQLGLMLSLALLTDGLKQETGIECYVKVSGKQQELPSDTETVLYRITQEAINNIRKHSKATVINIKILFGRNNVKLIISDNGIGFQVPKDIGILLRQDKLGIMGMIERSRLVSGKININSELGKGTTITVVAPFSLKSL